MSKISTTGKTKPKRSSKVKRLRVPATINGRARILLVHPLPEMSAEEIEQRAFDDPDNQPLTPENLARLPLGPRTKILRRSLGLTQQEFASRYCIPIGTLRDWEQGRASPDQPTRAYLTLIAHDPAGVRHVLQQHPDLLHRPHKKSNEQSKK